MSLSRVAVLLLLTIAGAGLSGVLLLQHHGEGTQGVAEQLCGEEEDSGCQEVATSPYSKVRGVPLAAVGLVFYLSLGALLLLSTLGGPELRGAGAAVTLALVALAVVIDVMLLGVQAFAIGRYCAVCLLTYVVTGAMLWLLVPTRRSVNQVLPALARVEGRVALAGWVLGSVALATAVGAANVALSNRAAQRQASLLGFPATDDASGPGDPVAPPPDVAVTPAPADPAGDEPKQEPETEAGDAPYGEELRRARAEARRLQEILDDPQKLQQYFDAKAAREFATAKREQLDLDQTPRKGPEDAPIRVVEYSDFLCPYCSSVAGAFTNFISTSSDRVAIYFKHYPLDQECNSALQGSLHTGACQLALGAVCAQEQGGFWQYHDKAFAAQLQNPGLDDVVRLAAESGLDFAALERCMGTAAAEERLEADIREGMRIGVEATPTVFVNGKHLPRINNFVQAVNTELQRLGLPPITPPPS
jgi:protein-disulfide isomerase